MKDCVYNDGDCCYKTVKGGTLDTSYCDMVDCDCDTFVIQSHVYYNHCL